MENLNRFLGKKVSVLINDRDIYGKKVWNKYTPIVGICTNIGYNTILKENQITVDRTPVFVEDWSKVSLVE